MLRYTLQRVVALLLTLFIIISLSFFVVRMMPGSPIDNPKLPEDIKKALEDKYHLNDPLIVQYGYFIKDFIKLDPGVSMKVRPKMGVFEYIKLKLPITMQLNVFALILIIPLGMILGIIAALRKNRFSDHFISFWVILFISVPSFVFASVMQYFLSFKWGWFPLTLNIGDGISWAKFYSMILPILALSFGGIATVTRYVRAELCEALNSEYMLLARAKGLTNVQATVRHAIRNSFIPLANIIIPMFTGLIFGSLVVEKIFAIPGMGGAMVTSINAHDHSLTIGILFFYSLISLSSILLVDLSYGIIDPRIRIGGRK
ncbi:ABC transporter permease [Clostridiaceae bacterium M8S5]|nr:ABC transporter permease [Clostridiaceae bacterium M8S5]